MRRGTRRSGWRVAVVTSAVWLGWQPMAAAQVVDETQAAPDEFCVQQDGQTRMLLRPEVFAEILKAHAASDASQALPNETLTNPEELWRVLETARAHEIELQLVSANPTGDFPVAAVSAGVTVDDQGAWIEPGD